MAEAHDVADALERAVQVRTGTRLVVHLEPIPSTDASGAATEQA